MSIDGAPMPDMNRETEALTSIEEIKNSFNNSLISSEPMPFRSVNEANLRLNPLARMIREHNQRFGGEHKSLAETKLEEANITLEEKPLKISLVRKGGTYELGLKFEGANGQSPDIDQVFELAKAE